jgi:hypothetical protein
MASQSSVGTFLVKTMIVVIAIVGLLTYLDNLVDNRVEQIESRIQSMRANAGPMGGRAFWSELERKLDKLADPASDLPPEKKQKILRNIRVLSERWRPFIDAAIVPEAKPSAPVNAN